MGQNEVSRRGFFQATGGLVAALAAGFTFTEVLQRFNPTMQLRLQDVKLYDLMLGYEGTPADMTMTYKIYRLGSTLPIFDATMNARATFRYVSVPDAEPHIFDGVRVENRVVGWEPLNQLPQLSSLAFFKRKKECWAAALPHGEHRVVMAERVA